MQYKGLFKFSIETGDHSTLVVILENPLVKDNYIEGMKVGELSHIDPNGTLVFAGIEENKFIAGGGPWTLEEFKDDLI